MAENPMRTGSRNYAFCMGGHKDKCSCWKSCYCSCHSSKLERLERKELARLKAKYESKKSVG